jgi:hypothetical protein
MATKTVLNLVVDTMLIFTYLIYVLLWHCHFLFLHYMSSREAK